MNTRHTPRLKRIYRPSATIDDLDDLLDLSKGGSPDETDMARGKAIQGMRESIYRLWRLLKHGKSGISSMKFSSLSQNSPLTSFNQQFKSNSASKIFSPFNQMLKVLFK